MKTLSDRLEELRTEIREERISYGEIAELWEYIDVLAVKGDIELLQWAGVEEEDYNSWQEHGGGRSLSEFLEQRVPTMDQLDAEEELQRHLTGLDDERGDL